MGSPKIPDPLPPPAARPERRIDVEANDIVLGSEKQTDPTKKGKKSLMRPSGNTVTPPSGSNALKV